MINEPIIAGNVGEFSAVKNQDAVNLEQVAMVDSDHSEDEQQEIQWPVDDEQPKETNIMLKDEPGRAELSEEDMTIEEIASEVSNFILQQPWPLLISDFPELCRDGSLPISLFDKAKFGFNTLLEMIEECAEIEDFEVVRAMSVSKQNNELSCFAINPINPEHWRWLFQSGFAGEQEDDELINWTKVPRTRTPATGESSETGGGHSRDVKIEASTLKETKEPIKIESLSVSEIANMLALSDRDLGNETVLKYQEEETRDESKDTVKPGSKNAVKTRRGKRSRNRRRGRKQKKGATNGRRDLRSYCFKFQKAACFNRMCPFMHICSTCESMEHGAKMCTKAKYRRRRRKRGGRRRRGKPGQSFPPQTIVIPGSQGMKVEGPTAGKSGGKIQMGGARWKPY